MNGKNYTRPEGKTGRCILICAGDMTVSEIVVAKEDLCIAVDGGYLYCKLLGLEPDFIVGDFDSVEDVTREELYKIKKEYPLKVITLLPEKDDTDTLAAIRMALEMGFLEFRIYGALGGRCEHTIANMQSLMFLKQRGAKGYLLDGTTMITVISNETIKFNASMEGFISIFSMGEWAEGVTLQGLKYPLIEASLTNAYPVGVSNEFMGEESSITVKKGALLLILSWPE